MKREKHKIWAMQRNIQCPILERTGHSHLHLSNSSSVVVKPYTGVDFGVYFIILTLYISYNLRATP